MQQAADDGLLWSFNDFNDAAFGSPFAVLAHDANLHAVLVQNGAHFIGRQIDVRLTAVTDQEAMTVTVPLHTAFDFFQQAAGWRYFFDIQSFYS
jgi:hypothetical protein